MRKLIPVIYFILAITEGIAQCSTCSNVTTYTVDLTASSNMSWSVTSVRSGLCCGASGINCIKFDVTVNPGVGSVTFDVATPAPPGGAFYQINCGPTASLGGRLCVAGMSNFCIVFCKSGNDAPTYTIKTHELSLTATVTPVSCFGLSDGAVATSVSGTGPFTYSWSPFGGTGPTATGLPAGVYTVTVTDVYGCTINPAYTVTQPTPLTATTSKTNVTCNGLNNGIIVTTAAGGNGGYTYAWSPAGGTSATAGSLAPGTYTVTVKDAKLCQTTATASISQPTALSISIASSANVSCKGASDGTVTAVASGGTPPYIYSWSSLPIQTNATASGLSSGTYTVTVTDANGCTATAVRTITEPMQLALSTSQTNISCAGGSNGTASVNVSGGTPGYTYNWNPGAGTASTASGLSAGSYSVTVTDSRGCTKDTTVTLTQPQVLSITTSATPVTCYTGTDGSATVSASGGRSPYTYLWSPSGGGGASAHGLSAGTYTVAVTDMNGCIATATAVVTEPVAVAAATSQINVSCNGGNDGSASVSTTGGTGIFSYLWAPGGYTASTVTGLTVGTYNVVITDNTGCMLSRAVTITQPATLTAAISVDNMPTCNGLNDGSLTAIVNGGTAPYTFSWSTSPVQIQATATNLGPGTYTVTVTDAKGCTAFAISTITEPPPLSASISRSRSGIVYR